MNLSFRVIEVTDKETRHGERPVLMRAVTCSVEHNGEPIDQQQWRFGSADPEDLPAVQVGDEFDLVSREGKS